ncbi:DMT family transporter [Paenibacillus beijingensis]|uniref:Multidrug transporter n=1 Tax=Paenibacillus beijingensis TaxID=1126833 RepID=A0A0D5NKP0_9BACL|nr:DMT family transporter [Paenibacillus beijingensis]AJY75680.1 multidrug transporter [Paenibacillus beijingensis]
MPRSLFVALFLLSLIWGGSFFFIKTLLHDFGPWTISFLRSALGLMTIAVVMLVLRKPFEFGKIPWVPMAVMALINTAVPWTVIAYSETRLASSMASVLNATTPLWTIIVGVLFFQTVTNRLQWLGMGLAFIGLVVLLGVNPVSIVSVDLLGFTGMMVTTLCYGVGSQLSKRLSNGLSMYQITFGTLLCSTICCGSIALSIEPITASHLAAPANIAVLVGLGIFGSGFAYILFYYMVQKGSPEFATMVTYLIPASAIIWGYTLLSEKIEWSLLTGLVLILGGVFLASKKQPGKAAGKQAAGAELHNCSFVSKAKKAPLE